MVNDIELINCIRKNVEMGIDGIQTVRNYAKAPEFINALDKQLKDYRELYSKADELLAINNGNPKDVSAMAKVSSEFMGTLRGMMGTTDAKIAEQMVRGTTTGVAKLTRQLHEYDGVNADVRAFADTVIRVEEANCAEMKKFL